MITCSFEDGGKGLLRHAVIDAVVVKENKVLLTKRNKKLLEGGKWSLVGGFVNRDETLKQTVAREIFEETGYRVKDITLLAINDSPNRPHEDRQNISFVFFCTALQKEGTSDWEVDAQKWYDFTNLPSEEEIAFDHYKDIQIYLDYKTKSITIPVTE
jgi:ADP-ribose pyrophosphatase YjhB (NUDIX family)